jgi:hypothetical protein
MSKYLQKNVISPLQIPSKAFVLAFLQQEERKRDLMRWYLLMSTNLDKERETASLATFLIITLLLPALLIAPVERDIRIITLINPFYAAAGGSFSPSQSPTPKNASPKSSSSIFLLEGRRALQSAIFTRHLQRILDALPSAAQVPKTDEGSSTVPVVSQKSQKSNIVAVSVSPGISRSDTIAPLLSADRSLSSKSWSLFGFIM